MNKIAIVSTVVGALFVTTVTFSTVTAQAQLIDRAAESSEALQQEVDRRAQQTPLQRGNLAPDTPVTSEDESPATTPMRTTQTDARDNRSSCTNRATAVNTIAERFVRLSERQLLVIGTIVERVDGYYRESGLEADGYADYLAANQERRVQLETAIAQITATQTELACPEAALREQLRDLRVQLQTVVTRVGEYRRTARELVVVVRTAAQAAATEGETEGENDSAPEEPVINATDSPDA
ncbi:MAG: hypothetical protein WD467_03580 [Candidatus Saccharimonadales bacterium]